MLSILVVRMRVDEWVKGKCRFQPDEAAHAVLQFYGAGLEPFSQAINKKCLYLWIQSFLYSLAASVTNPLIRCYTLLSCLCQCSPVFLQNSVCRLCKPEEHKERCLVLS